MPTSLASYCGVCGAVVSRITLLAPGEKPDGHQDWDAALTALWDERYASGGPRVVYRGIEAGSGMLGYEVSEEEALRYREILGPPLSVGRIRELQIFDDVGVCLPCGMPYCATHWALRGVSSLGTCPQGHRKVLDPY